MAAAESEDYKVHAKEYGLPSSHTMNTLVLVLYLVSSCSDSTNNLLYMLSTLWILLIAYSRMYLGFHTLVDIVAGVVLASACLHAYSIVDSTLDDWLVNTSMSGFATLGVPVLAMRLHPQPMAYTPSFEFSTSFLGCAFGLGMLLVYMGWTSVYGGTQKMYSSQREACAVDRSLWAT